MPEKLTYLAVCLLVLLNVVSTMGGNNKDYNYYNSHVNNSLCLSFRNKRLAECCKQDDMQRIYVHKTGQYTGIFHIKDFKKVLCYDKTRGKFRSYSGKNLGLERCRHRRRREREHRRRRCAGYKLSRADEEKLKAKGCELYDKMGGGFTYISAEINSLFLGLRRGRAQKHKKRDRKEVREPKDRNKQFMLVSESNFKSIKRHSVC
ncbi:uncharacterized protein LOC123506972 isoform X2 [Portunus trituberculatus]|uniref:uncharacterized protein LOC123506972 isoform X2 n=1 Tax=Portunus trituberculatus TaxID=210409 RepID=UPI001E1CFFAF|nr:uncharacterized protein LOC123506972 isoform X2 [Portunus trituberculatus]